VDKKKKDMELIFYLVQADVSQMSRRLASMEKDIKMIAGLLVEKGICLLKICEPQNC